MSVIPVQKNLSRFGEPHCLRVSPTVRKKNSYGHFSVWVHFDVLLNNYKNHFDAIILAT